MAEIVWAYCPHDREKQGTSEEVPDDMARAYVKEGLARYAPAKPAEPEPEPTPEPEPGAPSDPVEVPKPRANRVPTQAEASPKS